MTRTLSLTLIVGAGPAGLTLTIELARRGIPFLLIHREATPPATSRAIGTQSRTVEVFRLMGIPANALQPATRPQAFQFKEGERTLARVAFDRSTRDIPSPIIMDEADTERVLTERLERYGGHV